MGTVIRLSCFSVIFIIFFGFFCATVSQAKDTLAVDETLDTEKYLESSNGLFRLNFQQRPLGFYLGIQYLLYVHQTTKINVDFIPVWVALPSVILTSPAYLRMQSEGQLVIISWQEETHTVNVDQRTKIRNTTATLLDNGNLVLRAGSRTLWQSFDYPGNTWVPGMKIGLFNLHTGQPQQRLLTSWIAEEIPSPGAFTLGLDPSNKKELVVMRRGVPYWRSGIWNQENFTFGTKFSSFITNFSFFSNESDSYFSWNNSSFIQLNDMGQIVTIFDDSSFTVQLCDNVYNVRINWWEYISEGCVIPESSICPAGIINMTRGTMEAWSFNFINSSIGLSDCKEICRRNCSCTAYINASSDGTGCKFSTSETFTHSQDGENIYFLRQKAEGTLREAAGPFLLKRPRKWKIKLAIGVTITLLLILASSLLRRIVFVRGAKRLDIGEKVDDDRVLTFSLLEIKIATNNFCDANKLGQGGFGPVYKGKLLNGQEIAVKRLSTVSSHGIEQFKNEVILISKLQHRNLVSLLGHCTQGEERLLVYEYLPNKSLDSILFDATKQALLDWKMRVNIMQGIAQGLLYLHKYSRLKIIHRDLKTSNILLDSDMNPKISDFGTARIFQDNDSRANTKRIMGTYGYMSPEYAIDGLFSEKSDVFSFGVMVLEIISGKKNTGFYHSNHLNLLGYAWDLWTEGRIIELADPTLSEAFSLSSGLRYVQVALLCVQENAADRPIMLDVVSMLTNESIALSIPKQPAFYTIVPMKNGNASANPQTCSANKLTISDIEAR